MRKYGIYLHMLVFLIIALVSGCATSGGYPVVKDESKLLSIQQKYSLRLSKLNIGMNVENFKKIFPEAYIGGQRENTTAYEFIDVQSYVTQADIDFQNAMWGFGKPSPRFSKQALWFYFYDSKLVKWGRPQDWPERNYAIARGQNSDSENDPKENIASSGTGFAISENGLIVTAYHVIQDAKTIKIYLSKDSFISAKILSGDPVNDLAVLKIDRTTPNFLKIAPMRTATIGDKVFTIGYPVVSVLGQEAKYTEGVVSSLSGIKDASSFFQITVPVQPGNSGGALVNDSGEVIGIIISSATILQFIKESGTLPQNVNWAVKSDYIRPLIDLPEVEQKEMNRTQLIEHVKKSTFFIEAQYQQ